MKRGLSSGRTWWLILAVTIFTLGLALFYLFLNKSMTGPSPVPAVAVATLTVSAQTVSPSAATGYDLATNSPTAPVATTIPAGTSATAVAPNNTGESAAAPGSITPETAPAQVNPVRPSVKVALPTSTALPPETEQVIGSVTKYDLQQGQLKLDAGNGQTALIKITSATTISRRGQPVSSIEIGELAQVTARRNPQGELQAITIELDTISRPVGPVSNPPRLPTPRL